MAGVGEALVPTVIGGGFTLLGAWYTHHLQSRKAAVQSNIDYNPAAPREMFAGAGAARGATVVSGPSDASLRLGAVIRDVGILWLVTGIGGFLIGVFAAGRSSEDNRALVGLMNLIVIPIFFAVIAVRAPGNRWRHLFAVAILGWLTSIVNVIFGLTFADWISALIFSLVAAGVGGGISYAFRRR